jgi:ABC-type uncharacterized transport system substrate-binding protein
MRRRAFIGVIGAAAAWSLAARGEPAGGVPRVGVLMVEIDAVGQSHLKLFVHKLEELGWTNGRNVQIEVRQTGTDPERIQKFAKELVAWQPDVITANSTPGTAAVQRETRTIPIVFAIVSDPVGEGFVASLMSDHVSTHLHPGAYSVDVRPVSALKNESMPRESGPVVALAPNAPPPLTTLI